MQFELARVTYDSYMEKLQERKGVVEERIMGEEIRSPSVQLRVTPLGVVELLSTHDQLLGGPSGQSYLGCVFPADPGYAALITQEAGKVGKRLAKEGVIGRFALDFVVVRSNGKWEPYAIEINLRKGGTTHPFLTLQFLTDGTYDPETAIFTAPNGQQKFFVASDHVESPSYRTLTPDDLFDIVVRHDLHFDQTRQTGVVFHMMSALGELGRTGLTAVGNSHEDAKAMYERAVAVLDQETVAGATPVNAGYVAAHRGQRHAATAPSRLRRDRRNRMTKSEFSLSLANAGRCRSVRGCSESAQIFAEDQRDLRKLSQRFSQKS